MAALPVWAEPAPRNGLSYTTRGLDASGKEGSNLRVRSYVKPESKTPPAAEEHQEEKTDEETTAGDKAWQKYKALAAGQYKEGPKPESAAEEKPEDALPAEKPTGFAALLEQYQKNRAARSEMRTLVVTKPAVPEKPEAPEVEKPVKKSPVSE